MLHDLNNNGTIESTRVSLRIKTPEYELWAGTQVYIVVTEWPDYLQNNSEVPAVLTVY
jgi:hypothetical protein